MYTRRATLGALATTGVAALAGCSLLNDPLQREAEPAAVAESAANSTGFTQDELVEQVAETSVEINNESRDLSLTNWLNRYTRAAPDIELDAALFGLLTTPTVTVAGRSANPLRRLDRERLLQEMLDRLGVVPIENIQQVGERQVTVLGEAAPVEEFLAETEQEVSLRLHLGDRTHESDLLVLFALHPELLDLTGDVDTLAEGVVHPTERS
ncbi:MAG: hypothetical protein J07HX64_00366 [halophilic archaeon J07HX64]|jgi:hypothetical protein|nr:MAG: hypothetical protein J07HX64_00366 [halophilic archaeon J07HX64]